LGGSHVRGVPYASREALWCTLFKGKIVEDCWEGPTFEGFHRPQERLYGVLCLKGRLLRIVGKVPRRLIDSLAYAQNRQDRTIVEGRDY